MAFRASRFDAGLNRIADPFTLVAANPDVAPQSSVTALGGDRFALTWSDDNEVMVRVFRAGDAGNPVQFQASPADDAAGSGASIVLTLSDGNLAVIYYTAGQFSLPSADGLWAQVFTSAGVAVGPPVNIDLKPWRAFVPQAVALDGGGFAVTWTVRNENGLGDGSGSAIKAQRFDNAGVAQGPIETVNSVTVGDQVQPTIEARPGGYAVTWATYDTLDGSASTSRGEIAFRAYVADGGGTAGDDTLQGTIGADVLDGGAGNDFLYLQQGGDDVVAGGADDDVFYFGAALTAADKIGGGTGTDLVALQGNYAGLTFAADSLIGVESIAVLTSADARFGGGSASPYDYALTTHDANVAAGQTMKVNAAVLGVGEDFTFNGAAETDGAFFIYGGKGVDTLTGGAGVDVFFFAEDGRYAVTDVVNGGGGSDILTLRGDYNLTLNGTSLTNVETVALLSGSDSRFYPASTPFNYTIATAENTVAAGATMTINGALLRSFETLTFDGSAETDGAFRLFGGGGGDSIRGGAGNDLIFGGLSADTLNGGGGADTYRFDTVGDSMVGSRDTIGDFALGDILDLSRVDANGAADGNGVFSFIGAAAFTQAGQLRAVGSGGSWTIQGDVDGDGVADFEIALTVIDGHQIGIADFVL